MSMHSIDPYIFSYTQYWRRNSFTILTRSEFQSCLMPLKIKLLRWLLPFKSLNFDLITSFLTFVRSRSCFRYFFPSFRKFSSPTINWTSSLVDNDWDRISNFLSNRFSNCFSKASETAWFYPPRHPLSSANGLTTQVN